MANEVLSTGLQPELLVYSPHRIGIKIDAYFVIIGNHQYPLKVFLRQSKRGKRNTLMGSRILIVPILQKLEEFLCATLFKKAHQWTFDRLHFRAGNL
jgi:hypothetical protein